MMPTDDDVAVPPIGMRLADALSELIGAPAGYVDANVRWPGLERQVIAGDSGLGGAGTADDESAFATRWVKERFAILSPTRQGAAGAGVPELARVLRQGSELFAHLVVDLTGFDRLGEQWAAVEMVDAVVIVARAGRTREADVLALWREVPEARRMGVLLIGAAT